MKKSTKKTPVPAMHHHRCPTCGLTYRCASLDGDCVAICFGCDGEGEVTR